MKPWVRSPAVRKPTVVMLACKPGTLEVEPGGVSQPGLHEILFWKESKGNFENHLGGCLLEQWMTASHRFPFSSLSLDAPGRYCSYALIPLLDFQSSCDPCTCLDLTPPFAAIPQATVIREVQVARSSPQALPCLQH